GNGISTTLHSLLAGWRRDCRRLAATGISFDHRESFIRRFCISINDVLVVCIRVSTQMAFPASAAATEIQWFTRSAKVLADLPSSLAITPVMICLLGGGSHRNVLSRVVRRKQHPLHHLPAIQRIIPRSLCSMN